MPQNTWELLLRPLCTMIGDIVYLRGSVLLTLLFWPIAVFQMILAVIQRIVRIGTVYPNAAVFVPEARENTVKDNEEFLLLSATELAKRIRNPKDPLTSLLLVQTCIRQIQRVNPFINAVVATRFEDALREAAIADKAVAEGTVPPEPLGAFWGVPILSKECFEVTHFPFSGGVYSRREIVSEAMAPAVQSVVANGGAIILATTNVSEACMWHESVNRVYGRSNNPYDFARTCGGSSGGCGAGVAACMTPFAIGSDVGGSIRIPAHYNGLFGHKPTGGTVSNARCYPVVGNKGIDRYCQLGPMSKHAEDLWPLLLLLADSKDCVCPAAAAGVSSSTLSSLPSSTKASCRQSCFPLNTYALHAVDAIDISTIEICFSTRTLANEWLVSKMHPEVEERIHHVVSTLQGLGCRTTAFPIDSLIPQAFSLLNTFSMWSLLMQEGKDEPFKDVIRNQTHSFTGAAHICWETLLSIFELSEHTFPAMLMAIIEDTFDLTPTTHNDKVRHMAMLCKTKLEAYLASNRVWIMPSLPTPAPLHNESLLRIFDVSNTGFFNVMELPVTAIPVGLTSDKGLPIGVQVIGGKGQDHLCIAVAMALQRAGAAGWTPPVVK